MGMKSLGMVKMRWRRVLVAIACVAAAVAIGIRIWWVNANALSIPVERYGMDEWVELEGTYHFHEAAMSHGYSVNVAGAEVMTAQEYLDRYADGAVFESEDPDAKPDDPQVVLELVVRNDRDADIDEATIDTTGAIDMVDTVLIPHDAGGMLYTANFDLWAQSEEAFESSTIMWVGVMPGTEYAMFVPYSFVRVTGADDSIGADEPVSDTFDLVLGIAPVRREIEVTI